MTDTKIAFVSRDSSPISGRSHLNGEAFLLGVVTHQPALRKHIARVTAHCKLMKATVQGSVWQVACRIFENVTIAPVVRAMLLGLRRGQRVEVGSPKSSTSVRAWTKAARK